jgi:ATPase subunit of ABC transporter with duplicated ATPase domains
MISVSNLSKQFGDRTLFEGASFQLNSGQRYGLVGANGCGKTTLLNVMSGHMESTEGSVSIPKRLRLGVLRQDQFLYEEQEVLNVALMGNPDLWDAMAEKEKILAAAEGGEAEFDADRFGELEEIVQLYDGYTAEARAATILEGLGLPAEVHRRPLSTLSGGFRLRVLLAQVLASAPDVLLLDEPTNHLDLLSIRWLEKFLREFAGPVVVISHDHRFLDQVVTDILDVDYQTVMLYKGNYSFFINAKQEDRDRREKEISSREKEIAHHQKFVDRFKAKASKARQAGSKLKLIEKKSADLTALPGSSRRYPKFRFEPRRPSGKEVLTISGITKAFGENQVLHGVDLEVRRGDRLAIMGPNGIGKSTLLKIVMDDLEADEGEVKWGYETHRGYFAQDHKEDFDDASRTAEEWLWDFCASRDRGYVRGQMGMMLFSGDEGEKRLEALSGGEAARLIFSRLAIERPNVLILDEPTNHLDLESIEALVHGLKNFDGTLILVSHDRWFVSQLATRVVEIKPDEVRDYLGTYEEYVHFCGDDHLDSDSVVMKAKAERKDSKKSGKDSWKENKKARSVAPEVLLNRLTRQRDDLTRKIETAEARISEIDQAFCEPGFFEDTSADEVADLDNERAKLKGKVEDVMSQWEGVEREIERVPNS